MLAVRRLAHQRAAMTRALSTNDKAETMGLLLFGAQQGDDGKERTIALSALGQAVDAQVGGYITDSWPVAKSASTGESAKKSAASGPDVFSFVAPKCDGAAPPARRVAVVAAASGEAQPEHIEPDDTADFAAEVSRRETSRRAAALGARSLRGLGAKKLLVEPFPDVQACAEGIELALYKYSRNGEQQQHNDPDNDGDNDGAALATLIGDAAGGASSSDGDTAAFRVGSVYAQAQNWARSLATAPANLMTPTGFCDAVERRFRGVQRQHTTTMFMRDEHWLRSEGMGGVLGVAQGSEQPPRLLELHYRGASDANAAPVVLVGKGVTFDSGGISIKGAAGMDAMKADMTGAAVVAAALHGIARLRLPVNVVAVAPLVENMPSGRAIKPGDVLTVCNGKTVEVLNTDAEGRLILADALAYAAKKFAPSAIVDVATLTGAMSVALGDSFIGLWSTSTPLWHQLRRAGLLTGDRFWRMPLDRTYRDAMQGGPVSDLQNITKKSKAGSSTAAAFLSEFVPATVDRWAHLDIAGVMDSSGSVPYEPKGMSGKPVRALIEFVRRLADEQSG